MDAKKSDKDIFFSEGQIGEEKDLDLWWKKSQDCVRVCTLYSFIYINWINLEQNKLSHCAFDITFIALILWDVRWCKSELNSLKDPLRLILVMLFHATVENVIILIKYANYICIKSFKINKDLADVNFYPSL
jgi:hypothetical protein